MKINKKLNDLAINRLLECQKNRDLESAHQEADEVLTTLLVNLGYDDVVEEYHNIDKWYA